MVLSCVRFASFVSLCLLFSPLGIPFAFVVGSQSKWKCPCRCMWNAVNSTSLSKIQIVSPHKRIAYDRNMLRQTTGHTHTTGKRCLAILPTTRNCHPNWMEFSSVRTNGAWNRNEFQQQQQQQNYNNNKKIEKSNERKMAKKEKKQFTKRWLKSSSFITFQLSHLLFVHEQTKMSNCVLSFEL